LLHDELAYEPFKLQIVILYVLSNIGRKLGAVELGNILYLIDIEWASITSKTLTEQRYYKGKWGPYNPYLQRVVERMNGYEVEVTMIGKPGKSKLSHAVGKKLRFKPDLDEREIAAIQSLFDKIKDLSHTEIKKMTYDTTPMEAYPKKGENDLVLNPKISTTRKCVKSPQKLIR